MSDATNSSEHLHHKKRDGMAFSWEVIAALIGVISGISLFLSIVFDMGYFDAIGLRFGDVPSTIADHVRSALLWVPQVTASAFVYVLLELFQKNFTEMVPNGDALMSERTMHVVSKTGNWIFRAFIAISFIVVCVNALTGGQLDRYAPIASTIVIAYIVLSITKNMAAKNMLSPTKILVLCLFPITVLAVYNFGQKTAIEEKLEPRMATLTLDGQREVQVKVFRYLERGVFGAPEDGKLIFYRWEEVKRLSSKHSSPQRANLACQYLRLACPGVQILAPSPAPVVKP